MIRLAPAGPAPGEIRPRRKSISPPVLWRKELWKRERERERGGGGGGGGRETALSTFYIRLNKRFTGGITWKGDEKLAFMRTQAVFVYCTRVRTFIVLFVCARRTCVLLFRIEETWTKWNKTKLDKSYWKNLDIFLYSFTIIYNKL